MFNKKKKVEDTSKEINKDLEEAINAYIDEINEEKLDKSV
mgnify:CR=1 FL=1